MVYNIINCYSTGKVLNTSTDDKGRTAIIAPVVLNPDYLNGINISNNFYFDESNDDSNVPFLFSANNTQQNKDSHGKEFSATAWPNFGIASNTWKSMGGWNNGTPIYPTLYFE